MCITKACEEPTSVGVWWRDDAEWKQYDAPHATTILQDITDCANRVELGTLVSFNHAGGAKYVVDLSTMKQINLTSGYTRDVKVVNTPAAAAVTAASVDASVELLAREKSYSHSSFPSGDGLQGTHLLCGEGLQGSLCYNSDAAEEYWHSDWGCLRDQWDHDYY